MIKNVLDTTEYCRHCLMCRHVAPVGVVTHRETLTPHGVAQLIASERRGMIAWDADTVEALYAFSDNGNSRAHCVTSQPLGAAVAAARAHVVAQERAPGIVYELREKFRSWGNPYEAVSPEPPTGRGEVALFVGDEATYLHPPVLEAARTLLQAVEVDPVLIGRGRNNGFLASTLGLRDTAKELAQNTMEELEESGAKTLLALSPGDYFALGQMCDERLGVGRPDGVDLVDTVQLLSRKLEEGDLEVDQDAGDGSYAYVDPTHAVRVPTHHEPARRLAEAALPEEKRVELFWRGGRAFPCGNLGVQFTHPELADTLTKTRLQDARDVGARQVITEDAGSLYHLKRHTPSFEVQVQGLCETLADRLATAPDRTAQGVA